LKVTNSYFFSEYLYWLCVPIFPVRILFLTMYFNMRPKGIYILTKATLMCTLYTHNLPSVRLLGEGQASFRSLHRDVVSTSTSSFASKRNKPLAGSTPQRGKKGFLLGNRAQFTVPYGNVYILLQEYNLLLISALECPLWPPMTEEGRAD